MKKRDVILTIVLVLCGIVFIMCMANGSKEVKEETQIEYEIRTEKRAAELAVEPRMELRYNADGSSEWVNINE